MKLIKAIFLLFKDALVAFFEDRATIFAAGLAYYTIFALAPLLVLVTAVAGLFIGPSAAGNQITHQLQFLLGQELAGFLGELSQTLANRTANATATLLSIAVLLFSAGGIFRQLKTALNLIWGIKDVRPKNTREWLILARYRAIPFLMVLIFGLMLSVAVLLDAILAVVNARLMVLFPELSALPEIGRLLVPALTFATFLLVFKFLPDAYSRWRDVTVGALVTTGLFLIGRWLLAVFLSFSNTGSVYGAAGSVVVLLLWVYFSAQILLFGAEFTWFYALRHGKPIRPNQLSIFVTMADVHEAGNQ